MGKKRGYGGKKGEMKGQISTDRPMGGGDFTREENMRAKVRVRPPSRRTQKRQKGKKKVQKKKKKKGINNRRARPKGKKRDVFLKDDAKVLQTSASTTRSAVAGRIQGGGRL